MNYWLNLAVAFGQLLNALLAGDPDESLSARAYRTEQGGKRFGRVFRPLIDAIFFFDPHHCHLSYLAEQQRKQLPKEYQRG